MFEHCHLKLAHMFCTGVYSYWEVCVCLFACLLVCLFLISIYGTWEQYLNPPLQRPEFGFISFYVDVSLSLVPVTYNFPLCFRLV